LGVFAVEVTHAPAAAVVENTGGFRAGEVGGGSVDSGFQPREDFAVESCNGGVWWGEGELREEEGDEGVELFVCFSDGRAVEEETGSDLSFELKGSVSREVGRI
jgi:hypothetical protein